MMATKSGQLHPSWHAVIGDELEKPYMQALRDFLKQEKAASKMIFPPSPLIFMRLITRILTNTGGDYWVRFLSRG